MAGKCVSITVGGWTETVRGTYKREKNSSVSFSTYDRRVPLYYSRLCEGGFVIDQRPLADHPDFVRYVRMAPLENHTLQGKTNPFLTDPETRQDVAMMGMFMEGEFKMMAAMIATETDKGEDGEPGAFDYVSATTLAKYWAKRGARVGRRVGNTIRWNDGRVEEITDFTEENK